MSIEPAAPVSPAPAKSPILAILGVGVGVVTLVALVGLNLLRPGADNTVLDVQLVTMCGVLLAFLKTQEIVGATQQLHVLMNSRVTELVQVEQVSSYAQGREQGVRDATQAAVALAAQVAHTQAAANLVLAKTADDLAARAAAVLASVEARHAAALAAAKSPSTNPAEGVPPEVQS